MNLPKQMIRTLSVLAMAALACVVFAGEKDTLQSRIKPVGDVCMAGEDCAAAVVASNAGAEPRSGEQVYSTKCFTCHATGAAGAPKIGDAADWAARIAERSVDGLYDSAINGFKGMPAKGLCMDCSDDEIKASVDHMLVESGQ